MSDNAKDDEDDDERDEEKEEEADEGKDEEKGHIADRVGIVGEVADDDDDTANDADNITSPSSPVPAALWASLRGSALASAFRSRRWGGVGIFTGVVLPPLCPQGKSIEMCDRVGRDG